MDASGTLMVELVRGINLKSMDRIGFSPHVKLSLAGTTHKSKTIKKTLNPTWGERSSGERFHLGEFALDAVLDHPQL